VSAEREGKRQTALGFDRWRPEVHIFRYGTYQGVFADREKALS
jgi:hypothetical protein